MGSSRYSASSWEMWSHGSLRAVYDWERVTGPAPSTWGLKIQVTPVDTCDVIEILDAPPGSRRFGLLDQLELYLDHERRTPLVRAFGRPAGSKAPWGSNHSRRVFDHLDETSLNDIVNFVDPVDVAVTTPLGDFTVVVTGGVIVTGLREMRRLVEVQPDG